MLNFFVSKALSETMGDSLPLQPVKALGSMRWFAHSVPVVSGDCALLMEDETRYCIVFHELSAEDYARFPQLFCERLCREVAALCQQPAATNQRLLELVRRTCAQFQFTVGLDYSASAPLFDASRALQATVESLGNFPVVGVTEFGLGIKINQQVRHTANSGEEFVPLDEFRRLWMEKLDNAGAAFAIDDGVPDSLPANVVKLDKQRGKSLGTTD